MHQQIGHRQEQSPNSSQQHNNDLNDTSFSGPERGADVRRQVASNSPSSRQTISIEYGGIKFENMPPEVYESLRLRSDGSVEFKVNGITLPPDSETQSIRFNKLPNGSVEMIVTNKERISPREGVDREQSIQKVVLDKNGQTTKNEYTYDMTIQGEHLTGFTEEMRQSIKIENGRLQSFTVNGQDILPPSASKSDISASTKRDGSVELEVQVTPSSTGLLSTLHFTISPTGEIQNNRTELTEMGRGFEDAKDYAESKGFNDIKIMHDPNIRGLEDTVYAKKDGEWIAIGYLDPFRQFTNGDELEAKLREMVDATPQR